MTPAAIYVRVSTGDQSTEAQRLELERMAAARGLEVIERYDETASSAGARPELERMRRDAHRGRWRVLLVWAIDRLGRSLAGNIELLLELERNGVRVVSAREPWLDAGGPTRGLLISIFSWIAEQERARILERTRAGLDVARRKGVKLGRPPRHIGSAEISQAHARRAAGASWRTVAAELGLSVSVLHRAARVTAAGATVPKSPPSGRGGATDRKDDPPIRSRKRPF